MTLPSVCRSQNSLSCIAEHKEGRQVLKKIQPIFSRHYLQYALQQDLICQ